MGTEGWWTSCRSQSVIVEGRCRIPGSLALVAWRSFGGPRRLQRGAQRLVETTWRAGEMVWLSRAHWRLSPGDPLVDPVEVAAWCSAAGRKDMPGLCGYFFRACATVLTCMLT